MTSYFYTSAWCLEDERAFKNAIPFELFGKSIQKYQGDSKEMEYKVKIIMFEGFEKLSDSYKESLKEYGFEIEDHKQTFLEILRTFPNINNYYSQYERNCFLRWIVFKKIFGDIGSKENSIQFWHLDADVVLHAPLADIARDTTGKTFMLQGCPAFVSIADGAWFTVYEQELKKLEQNIIGYSEQAHQQKNSNKKLDTDHYNQSLYRNPLGSDQDLLEYLIGSNIIPQASRAELIDSVFFYLQNPLVFNRWNEDFNELNFVSNNTRGEIFYGDKKIPFIHYQNDFCSLVEIYRFFVLLNIEKSWLVKFFWSGINYMEYATLLRARILNKIMKMFRLKPGRKDIIRFLEQTNPHNNRLYIVDLLNHINNT